MIEARASRLLYIENQRGGEGGGGGGASLVVVIHDQRKANLERERERTRAQRACKDLHTIKI
jgi:hypothetical protein